MTAPRWVVLVLVAVTASNAYAAPALSGIPLNPALLALGVLTAVYVAARGRLELRVPAALVLFAIAVAAMVPAVLFAKDLQASWVMMNNLFKDLLFLAILLVLGPGSVTAATVARVFTATLGVLGGITVVNQFVLHNSTTFFGFSVLDSSTGVGFELPRHAGPFEDPNFFGRILTMAVPLALALGLIAWQRRNRTGVALWSATVLALLGGIYLTGSRGAMLGVGVAALMVLVVAGPATRRLLAVMPLVLIAAFFVPGVGSRLSSLTEVGGGSGSFAQVDASIAERAAVLKVVYAIFLDNPVLGVGPGNASTVAPPYVAAGEGAITRATAAHNTFLQLAAETGVVGLLGWLVFLLGSILLALRVVRAEPIVPGTPPSEDRLLAAGAAAAVTGWVVASIFLHLSYLRPLLDVIAIVGLLSLRAPEFFVVRPRRKVKRNARGLRRVRDPVVVGMVGVLVLAVVAAALPLLYHRVWVARVPVSLVASPADGVPPDAYHQALTTRRVVVASYAAVMQRIGAKEVGSDGSLSVLPRGSTRGSGLAASFVVQVEASDRESAERLAGAAARAGSTYIADLPALAVFAQAKPGTVTSSPRGAWRLP